jgi:enoyl-CoA hydratase
MSDAYASFERLKFDRPAPGVLRIRLATPNRLNVMDARSHEELSRIWAVVQQDDSVLSVLLTGEGEAFSAGGDLKRQKEVVESHEQPAATCSSGSSAPVA